MIVETMRLLGICVEVIARLPGPGREPAGRRGVGAAAAEELGVVGSLAVELFETSDGVKWSTSWRCAINSPPLDVATPAVRTAPARGAGLSAQYDRADAPLTVMANVLSAPHAPAISMDERLHHLFARMPDAKVPVRQVGTACRKIRHVEPARRREWFGCRVGSGGCPGKGDAAACYLSHGEWTDGWDAHA